MKSCGWDKQVMWMGLAGHVDGISRSRGWDKEIPNCVLPMGQLVLSDKWARRLNTQDYDLYCDCNFSLDSPVH